MLKVIAIVVILVLWTTLNVVAAHLGKSITEFFSNII
ncbi:hypothetical protein [Providencia phage PSTCR5]|uniref:Uncharacterized protein n=1 Tax=Providencia phage PSTCR5 TaxID=2783547 RepID=A0A873WL71_9CAUD|nr:hypothetical protein KNV68_gp073 [Providencia phage PSTCR5]QPB12171.1 hypothetical protein [Providencia phage PSTCR5]